MSPEQLRGEELDTRSDLFPSLGLVVYEMATGCRAFKGRSNGVICDAVLNSAPVCRSKLNRKVPLQLEHIINRALEKDRKLRYQTARDIGAELQCLRRDIDSGVSPVVRPVSRLRDDVYKKVGWLGLGVAFVALALLLLSVKLPPSIPRLTRSDAITNDGRQKGLPDWYYPVVTDGARLFLHRGKRG